MNDNETNPPRAGAKKRPELLPEHAARRRRAEATPELLEELAAIDAVPEFAGKGKEVEEARILRKLEIYSAWLTRHALHLPSNGNKANVAKILAAIRHAGARKTDAIGAAIRKLADLHGFASVNLRHNPEQPIDKKLDLYEQVVLERGKGPPRMADNPEKICQVSSAKEIPCAVRDLDKTAMSRLRAIAKRAAEPGDLVELPADERNAAQHKFNPAVAPLLRKSLAGYGGQFPADPLDPNKVDLITITWNAGVSVADCEHFEGNMKVVRDAVAKGRLVPNPILKERVYTYRDLIDHGRARREADPGGAQDSSNEASKSVAALRLFMGMPELGGTEADPVPHDFRKRVEKARATPPARADSRWSKQMERWQDWNSEMRAKRALPEQFGLTLRVLCAEMGMTVHEAGKAAGNYNSVVGWMAGRYVPSLKQGAVLERLGVELDVPKSTLEGMLSDQWRQKRFDLEDFMFDEDEEHPDPIAVARKRRDLHQRHLPGEFAEWGVEERREAIDGQVWGLLKQDLEYTRRLADQSTDEYVLPAKDWPDALKTAWHGMIPKGKRAPLRRPGEEHDAPDAAGGRAASKRRDVWAKDTINLRRRQLEEIFGYFHRAKVLPEETRQWQPRMTDFTPEAGLGIPRHLLHPVLFVIPDLISSFCWWRARRSGTFGRMLPAYVALASEFLRPNTGCVHLDPSMKEHLKRFKEWWDAETHTLEMPMSLDIEEFISGDWEKAVAKAYEKVRADYRRVRGGKLPKTRDPFLPIAVFVDSKEPMTKYMKGVRNVLAAKATSIDSRHTNTRNGIMALIEVQTALRAKNMVLTISGPNPTLRKVETDEDGEVWRVQIPAAQFKNHGSPYFGDDESDYILDLANEDDLYDLLERYIEQSRPYLLAGRRSDKLFINNEGGDITARSLSAIWRRMVQLHFIENSLTGTGAIKGAMPHGIHSVRHISATHIVRVTGDLVLAAYAIQDDIATAMKYYARFIPKEKARLAAAVLSAGRLGIKYSPPNGTTLALAA